MNHNVQLTIASLLSILLMTLHVTDDIIRGLSRAAAENVFGVVIFVVWIFGTLVLAERRSGYVIMLLGGIFAAAMPVIHMRGSGYGAIANSNGGFFFVWTLFAVFVLCLIGCSIARASQPESLRDLPALGPHMKNSFRCEDAAES